MEKCVWLLIVCLGFIGAGLLIGRSLSDWQESPISSSITTRPLEELEFPQITVCPKIGSNTALNPDLMRAGNNSLTDKTRGILLKAAFDIFTNLTYQKYVGQIMDMVGEDYVKNMFDGFSTIPKPFGRHGLEIRMWKNKGNFKTPGFKGVYREKYHKESKAYHVVLDLPKGIAEQIGNGSLIV